MSYALAILGLAAACTLWARLQVANDRAPTPGCGPCGGCDAKTDNCPTVDAP